MKMLMMKLVLLTTTMFTMIGCVEDAPDPGLTSLVTVESSAYTNDGTVAYIFKPQVDSVLDFFIPTAFAGPISSFRFCITKLKIVSAGETLAGASQEARLGLVDISDPNISNDWGKIEIAEGQEISELHFEVHKDAQSCSGADYSVNYNGQKLNKDLEFKFKFSPALVANHGDTINLQLGVIAKAMEDATIAGQFNDTQISNFMQINTIGTGQEL